MRRLLLLAVILAAAFGCRTGTVPVGPGAGPENAPPSAQPGVPVPPPGTGTAPPTGR